MSSTGDDIKTRHQILAVNADKIVMRPLFFQRDSLNSYLLVSLLATLALCGTFLFNLEAQQLFFQGPLLLILLVGHFNLWIVGYGRNYLLQGANAHAGLFLFQIFLLVGCAFFFERPEFLYLASLPCAFGTYYLFSQEQSSGNSEHNRRMSLLSMLLCSYLFFWGITGLNVLTPLPLLLWLTFSSWCLGPIFLNFALPQRAGHALLKALPSPERRQRLFFHDVINQLHGLNLFFNHKLGQKRGMSHQECQSALEEIKLLQCLMKDHYGWNHKNLVNTYEYGPFYLAQKAIFRLIETYLPAPLVESNVFFRGDLAGNQDQQEKNLIHFPSFFRILTNLIKNVAEHRTDQMVLVFEYDAKGLTMQVRNKILYLRHSQKDLEEKLGDIILEEEHGGRFVSMAPSEDFGLGLESVAEICEQQGGSFQFYLEGDYWVTRVFLPRPVILSQKAG